VVAALATMVVSASPATYIARRQSRPPAPAGRLAAPVS
jgi:hypothetical protein